jgi:SAM-dependent methyltransferase
MIPVNKNTHIYRKAGAGTKTLNKLDSAERYHAWLANYIKPYLGKYNLEIGAGHGAITRIVALDYNVDLLEPAETSREHLVELVNNNNRIKSLYKFPSEIPSSKIYNSIFSANVLEHIYDDKSEIEKYLRILSNNGKIVGIVPGGGKLLYSRFDRLIGHYRRYSLKDLKRLCVLKDNFNNHAILKHYQYLNPLGALGWLFIMKLLGRTEISEKFIKGSQKILKLNNIIRCNHIPFGQSMLIVWEKRI